MSERRRHPVAVLRDRAAAESVERKVADVNESLRNLGITEEVLVVSRELPDGSYRLGMSHSTAEVSALGVVARAVIEGRAGLWDGEDGLLASGAPQISAEDAAALWKARQTVRRIAGRHDVWREALSREVFRLPSCRGFAVLSGRGVRVRGWAKRESNDCGWRSGSWDN